MAKHSSLLHRHKLHCRMLSGGFLMLVASNAYAVLASDVRSLWKLPPPRSFGAPGINASYDYVIIGGGTAGLTIASRLSENHLLRVAVVEQGGFYELDNGNLSTVPAYCTYYSGTDPDDINPLVDFGFVTQPQAVCFSDAPLVAMTNTSHWLSGCEGPTTSLYAR